MTGKVKNNHNTSKIVKSLLLVILALLMCVGSNYTNNLTAQGFEKVKYYKEANKNQYYIQFVNEIPYFLINRYNEYYEVISIEGRNSEAIFYENGEMKKRWVYSYPEKDIMRIDYKDVIIEEKLNTDDESNNLIKDKFVNNYDVFYHDMGQLVKKEHYEDDNLKFYFDINYDRAGRVSREYYFNANNTRIYKYYSYKENVIRSVTREGILKNKKTDHGTTINEKWIYKNKKINELEKYDGHNLKEKFYYNNFGKIEKKEIYNDLQRIDRFCQYNYNNKLELSRVKEFIPNDPLSSDVTNSYIVKDYKINKNTFTLKEYNNGILENETVIYKDRKNITEKTYDLNGDIINLESYRITDEYSVEGYNSSAEAVTYSVSIKNPDKITTTTEVEKDIKTLVSDEDNLVYSVDIYSDGQKTKDIIYNAKNKKLIERIYNENGELEESKNFIIMSDFNEYIASLRIDPAYDIVMFPPDK